MNPHRLKLIAALLFPIVVLAANAWMNQQQRANGTAVTLPIQGVDPRDLLSGHYLIFEMDYGIKEGYSCPVPDISATLCLNQQARVYPSDELPASCSLFLRGTCNSQGDFNAGLERFYIPEEHASLLEQHIQDNKGKLVLSINKQGQAAIRDLLINDQPWRKHLEAQNDE